MGVILLLPIYCAVIIWMAYMVLALGISLSLNVKNKIAKGAIIGVSLFTSTMIFIYPFNFFFWQKDLSIINNSKLVIRREYMLDPLVENVVPPSIYENIELATGYKVKVRQTSDDTVRLNLRNPDTDRKYEFEIARRDLESFLSDKPDAFIRRYVLEELITNNQPPFATWFDEKYGLTARSDIANDVADKTLKELESEIDGK